MPDHISTEAIKHSKTRTDGVSSSDMLGGPSCRCGTIDQAWAILAGTHSFTIENVEITPSAACWQGVIVPSE